MSKKLIIGFILFVAVLFTGIPRFLAVDTGLPYNQYYDEPLITQGALNGLKAIFDENEHTSFLPVSSEVVYGGFMRYTCMLQDALYYQYIYLTDPNVYSLQDIKTSMNGEQILTVSHPGFYYWNRVYHAALSVLVIIVTFLLVRKLYGTIYGVMAILLLAGNTFYYNSSFILVSNVPLALMTIVTVYFSIEYNMTKKYKYLLWSLFFCGLAMATKMTGAAVILVPFIAGILNYSLLKKDSILKTILKAVYLGLIPLGIFLILNPSVYLDTDLFMYWMRWLSDIYKSGGMHAAQEPGIPHLMFQVNQFIEHHGKIWTYVAIVGTMAGLSGWNNLGEARSKQNVSNTLILIVFPVVYLLYVTMQYKISYHRNFILYYPILTVLSMGGAYFILESVKKYFKWGIRYSIVYGIVCLLILWQFYPKYKNIYKQSNYYHNSKDTRTLYTSQFISDTNPPFQLGIESGLKMSLFDLKDIPFQFGFFDIDKLDSARLGFTHLMVPDYVYRNDTLSAFPDSTINHIISVINANLITKIAGTKIDFFHDLHMWDPIVNPSIKLIKGSDYPPPYLREFSEPILLYPMVEIVDHIEDIIFTGFLLEGEYTLSFQLAGTEAVGEYPSVEIRMNDIVVDTIVSKSSNYEYGSLTIVIDQAQVSQLKVRLVNDYWDPETGEDRNAYFKTLMLKKDVIFNE